MARPRGGDWLDDDVWRLALSGVGTLVCLLTHAEIEGLDLRGLGRACERMGVRLVNFPIAHPSTPPLDGAYRLALAAREQVEAGMGVVFHCRAGIGRASIMAACVLILGGIPVRQAFDAIARARGLDVPDTPQQLEAFASRLGSSGPPEG